MKESVKETVIIVHGTWAAPEPGASRWYQPSDGIPATEGFIAELNAALQERGSLARCWAHCTQGDQIFQWSGENSWIARTRAASAFGDYVANLRKKGWCCHIVAHSHGGNVVVEALPQIMTAPSSDGPLGKIVTLGTPFIDTMSLIRERAKRRAKILNVVSSTVLWLCALPIAMKILFAISLELAIISGLRDEDSVVVFLIGLLVFFGARLFRRKMAVKSNAEEPSVGALQTQPTLLAMGSRMDEAWQILHHLRETKNPLAIGSNIFHYWFTSLRSHLSRSAEVAHIYGAKSYRDLGTLAKLALACMHFLAIITIASLIMISTLLIFAYYWPVPPGFSSFMLFLLGGILFCPITLLALTKFFGEAFHSAFWSPFRWCANVGKGLLNQRIITTYFVRKKGWSVLQRSVMGLEDYRFEPTPDINLEPKHLPKNFVKFEPMPACAEQRALAMRNGWISQHFGNVSETFSHMVVTAADISLLLYKIEADQSPVHAAYYKDSECIARIADWIVDRG